MSAYARLSSLAQSSQSNTSSSSGNASHGQSAEALPPNAAPWYRSTTGSRGPDSRVSDVRVSDSSEVSLYYSTSSDQAQFLPTGSAFSFEEHPAPRKKSVNLNKFGLGLDLSTSPTVDYIQHARRPNSRAFTSSWENATAHKGSVGFAVSKDHKNSVIVATRSTVKLLDIVKDEMTVEKLDITKNAQLGSSYLINHVQWGYNYTTHKVAAACGNGSVVLFDISKPIPYIAAIRHDFDRSVNKVAFGGPSGQLLMSSSQNGKIRFYDIREKSQVAASYTMSAPIRNALFSPSPEQPHTFVALCASGTLLRADLRYMVDQTPHSSHQKQDRIMAHIGSGLGMDWTVGRGQNWLATSGQDQTVKIWDMSQPHLASKPINTLHVSQNASSLSWNPQKPSEMALTFSSSNHPNSSCVQLWDTRRPFLPRVSIPLEEAVTQVYFNDGDTLWTTSRSQSSFSQIDIDHQGYVVADTIPAANVAWNALGEVSFVNDPPPTTMQAEGKELDGSQLFSIDGCDPTFDPEKFTYLAEHLRVEGESLLDVCRGNAKAYAAVGRDDASQLWLTVEIWLTDSLEKQNEAAKGKGKKKRKAAECGEGKNEVQGVVDDSKDKSEPELSRNASDREGRLPRNTIYGTNYTVLPVSFPLDTTRTILDADASGTIDRRVFRQREPTSGGDSRGQSEDDEDTVMYNEWPVAGTRASSRRASSTAESDGYKSFREGRAESFYSRRNGSRYTDVRSDAGYRDASRAKYAESGYIESIKVDDGGKTKFDPTDPTSKFPYVPKAKGVLNKTRSRSVSRSSASMTERIFKTSALRSGSLKPQSRLREGAGGALALTSIETGKATNDSGNMATDVGGKAGKTVADVGGKSGKTGTDSGGKATTDPGSPWGSGSAAGTSSPRPMINPRGYSAATSVSRSSRVSRDTAHRFPSSRSQSKVRRRARHAHSAEPTPEAEAVPSPELAAKREQDATLVLIRRQITNALLDYADLGDAQLCCMAGCLLNRHGFSFDAGFVARNTLAYVKTLRRLELHVPAAYVIKHSSVPAIATLSQTSVEFHMACAQCSRALEGTQCSRCGQSLRCVICHLPLEALMLFKTFCGHVSHPGCLETYFGEVQGRLLEIGENVVAGAEGDGELAQLSQLLSEATLDEWDGDSDSESDSDTAASEPPSPAKEMVRYEARTLVGLLSHCPAPCL